MKTKNIVLSVGGLLLAGTCLAWGGSHKCPCEGSAAAATPAVATPDHPEPKVRDIEHTHMIAPAVLTLEQGATDASGVTEYLAHIDVQDQINYPVVLLLLVILVLYVTMVYGPIAAWLVELFPARIRYTSMSLPYHIGNGWFGGFLPTVAFALVALTGDIYYGLWYPIAIAGATLIIGLFFLPETFKRSVDA